MEKENITFPNKFASRIYNKDFTLQEVEDDQIKLKILINKLNNDYSPISKIKNKEKEDTLKSAKKLFSIREEIIRAFKRGTFPYIDGIKVDKQLDEESDEESDEQSDEQSDEELDKNKFSKDIDNESKDINYDLSRIYFNFVAPTVLAKKLFETKDKKKMINL